MVNMMDAATTFTLMIAGGDYCDIVNDTLNYYDTADQAYEDGIAVDLMEYPDSIPNFSALMEKYPQIRSDLETLEGHILNMPRIDMPIGQAAENGLLIRKDWLDDLGLDMPNSYDEMHDVLAAFKSVQRDRSLYYALSGAVSLGADVLGLWHSRSGRCQQLLC